MTTLAEFEKTVVTPYSVMSSFMEGVEASPSSSWVKACCPFHDDSTPSFSVHSSSGNWRCHTETCGKSGKFAELPNAPKDIFPVATYKYTKNGVLK